MSSVKLKASIGSMIDVHAVATLDGWLRAIGSSLLPFAAVGDWGRGGEHLFCIKPYRRRPLSVTPTHPFSRAIIEPTTSVLTRAPYIYAVVRLWLGTPRIEGDTFAESCTHSSSCHLSARNIKIVQFKTCTCIVIRISILLLLKVANLRIQKQCM